MKPRKTLSWHLTRLQVALQKQPDAIISITYSKTRHKHCRWEAGVTYLDPWTAVTVRGRTPVEVVRGALPRLLAARKEAR